MKISSLSLVAGLFLACSLPAQTPRPSVADDFKPLGANWQVASGLGGDPRIEKKLIGLPGDGILVNNTTKENRAHLVTAWDHGDLELELDFLLTPGSNSGVYLMGRYEIQLFDSWGKKVPQDIDCGAIYHRWDAARGKGKESYDGFAPRANASRAPGLWQNLRVEFRAPRFDADGKKIANAKFVRVLLNDFLIHENVEVTGPTRSALFETGPEAARGPIMIQGDHGPIAIRRLSALRFDTPPVTTSGLTYELRTGEKNGLGDYSTPPTATGTLDALRLLPMEKSGKSAFVIKGTIRLARADTYTFTTETRNPARLVIAGETAIAPLELGGDGRTLTLPAGDHPFQLDYRQARSGRPSLKIGVRGVSLAPQSLTYVDPAAKAPVKKTLLIEPTDRPRLQRGFVPFEPKKRLYALSVGSPGGAHYAYDLEAGTLLRAWRGAFLDTVDMWEGRGEPQLAEPAGPALTLNAKPTVALLERSAYDWPDTPDALWSSQGYTLAADGSPTFLSKLGDLSIRDRITPAADGRSLTRALTLVGRNTSWETHILLAEAATITPQPDGRGWIVGDRAYYLDLPKDSALKPTVRTRQGRQQLTIPISGGKVDRTLTYSLVW